MRLMLEVVKYLFRIPALLTPTLTTMVASALLTITRQPLARL